MNNSEQITTIIIEDSRLARNDLKALLKEHKGICILDEAENTDDALKLIQQHNPDLIFLDIHMPGESGFELLEKLPKEPAIIFTTAFSEYALESFEHNTVDYLMKPISPYKLERAIKKAELYLTDQNNQTAENDLQSPISVHSRIFLRDKDICHLVKLSDISHFEICGNYSKVFFEAGFSFIQQSLSKLESRLPNSVFFRANRQHIVNVHRIESVQPWINGGYKLRLNNEVEIEVSRRHAHRFTTVFSI